MLTIYIDISRSTEHGKISYYRDDFKKIAEAVLCDISKIKGGD